jgi:hypothetical protein
MVSMRMASGTVCPDLMGMVGRSVVGMMAGQGMAGLAYSVPGRITFIEGKIVRPLLENREVKSTFNVPWLTPDELKVDCLYPGVGVYNRVRPVRVVT